MMEQPRESVRGCAGCFRCLLRRFLGTDLTDEDGQKSDMDNPACDCLIVHWAVLNISNVLGAGHEGRVACQRP